MDIQVSSNFERLLFDAADRDPAVVRAAFASLEQSGGFDIPSAALTRVREDFDARAVNEAETSAEIARTYREAGYVLDPHTATGVTAARARLKQDPSTPVVALATAHPAKFPDAIFKAIGLKVDLPERLAPIMTAPERSTRLDADESCVKSFIERHARATSSAAKA